MCLRHAASSRSGMVATLMGAPAFGAQRCRRRHDAGRQQQIGRRRRREESAGFVHGFTLPDVFGQGIEGIHRRPEARSVAMNADPARQRPPNGGDNGLGASSTRSRSPDFRQLGPRAALDGIPVARRPRKGFLRGGRSGDVAEHDDVRAAVSGQPASAVDPAGRLARGEQARYPRSSRCGRSPRRPSCCAPPVGRAAASSPDRPRP